MVKKQTILMVLLLLLAVVLTPAITVNAGEPEIRVAFGGADWENSDFHNGDYVPDYSSLEYVQFPDVQPINIDDRVFVPVRPVVEAMAYGRSVTWDEDTSTATVVSFWGLEWEGDEASEVLTELVMRQGYAYVTRKNTTTGQTVFTDTPELLPQIVDGRFMVPLRTLEYALYSGDVLVWDDKAKTAYILGVAG